MAQFDAFMPVQRADWLVWELLWVSSEPFCRETEHIVPFPPSWLCTAVYVRVHRHLGVLAAPHSSGRPLMVVCCLDFSPSFLVVSVFLQPLQLCDVFFLFTAKLSSSLKSKWEEKKLRKCSLLLQNCICRTVMFYSSFLVGKKCHV